MRTCLRDPFRRDKGACLDGLEPRLGESFKEFYFGPEGDRLLLVLQAIAGPDLDDADVVGATRGGGSREGASWAWMACSQAG